MAACEAAFLDAAAARPPRHAARPQPRGHLVRGFERRPRRWSAPAGAARPAWGWRSTAPPCRSTAAARSWFEARGLDPVTGGHHRRRRLRTAVHRAAARTVALRDGPPAGRRPAADEDRERQARRLASVSCAEGSPSRCRPATCTSDDSPDAVARAEVAGVAAPHPRLAAAHGGRLRRRASSSRSRRSWACTRCWRSSWPSSST